MRLSDKLRLLRTLEGNLRGYPGPLTKSDVSRLLKEELGETLSQAYLSQLESGKRLHMTEHTRNLLARFFKVHPGYLVSDPDGFQSDLETPALRENRIDTWLEAAGLDMASDDPELGLALRQLAGRPRTREVVLLLARLVTHPELLDELKLNSNGSVES